MLDAIFNRAAIPLPRVAPIMLRDEFLFRTGFRRARVTPCPRLYLSPLGAVEPRVFAIDPAILVALDIVAHWDREVRLVVHEPRSASDRSARNELANKHYTAPHFPSDVTSYVEAQVHFGERAMTGNGNA
jgi:hypothetical protein